MRKIFVILGLLAVAILPSSVAALDQPSEYATLLASLKAGKTDIDYARLRISYMDSPEYKAAKDTSDSEKAMIAALNNKDYPAALKIAEIVLSSDYVNMDAHFVAMVANRELGAKDKSEFHYARFSRAAQIDPRFGRRQIDGEGLGGDQRPRGICGSARPRLQRFPINRA